MKVVCTILVNKFLREKLTKDEKKICFRRKIFPGTTGSEIPAEFQMQNPNRLELLKDEILS